MESLVTLQKRHTIVGYPCLNQKGNDLWGSLTRNDSWRTFAAGTSWMDLSSAAADAPTSEPGAQKPISLVFESGRCFWTDQTGWSFEAVSGKIQRGLDCARHNARTAVFRRAASVHLQLRVWPGQTLGRHVMPRAFHLR